MVVNQTKLQEELRDKAERIINERLQPCVQGHVNLVELCCAVVLLTALRTLSVLFRALNATIHTYTAHIVATVEESGIDLGYVMPKDRVLPQELQS